MDQQSLENHLADLALGEIRYFDTIDSTNNYAAQWANEGAPDSALVIANQQTAGRGRGLRHWFTPPGAALAFSLVLRPKVPDQDGHITRIAGLGALGVSKALRTCYHLPAEIKWPNDVIIHGRKVCGILSEAAWLGDQLSAVILGIGINVDNSAVPSDDWPGHHERPFPAGSIEGALGSPLERTPLLHRVLLEMLELLPRLEEPDFIQSWREKLAFLGDWVEVTTSGTETHQGQVAGLSEDGSLRLRLRSGEQITLQVGEIHLRPVDSPI
jgi:BirA family transcriptional regulator, biotin operon repressor / biotin---[acetyl-CoA-carboxylase] ligase